MPDIQVLIVDDQALLREGIRTLLELEGGFMIVGMARDGAEAATMFEALRPDVVLMDIRMPGVDGIEATRRIMAYSEGARVLMLTTFAEDALLFEALRAGARGYLLKDASAAELAAAIREVHAGNAALEPGIAMKVIQSFQGTADPRPAEQGATDPRLDQPARSEPAPSKTAFSRRELEVLRLLAEGFSNKEIAERLFLAEGTVKNRVSDILSKIDARDRTQAALRARELGLL